MTLFKELILTNRKQYIAFAILLIGVAGFTVILYFSNSLIFQRFIGGLDPLAATLFIAVLGFLLLSLLLSKGWFAIYKKGGLKGLLRASGIAALFGLIIIIVDLKLVFPADTNILFPESLLFYPAIGFFAEIIFHVLPLSVLLVSLTSIFKNISPKKIVWFSILMVSLLEPVYQVIPMAATNYYPAWGVAYVGLHIFLINLSQLLIFKRYDFITMYTFRLVYYLFWHIGWGYIRLKLLF